MEIFHRIEEGERDEKNQETRRGLRRGRTAAVHGGVKLSDVSTPNRIVLKGCDNVTLTADGQAGMSTLAADPADSAAITFGDTVSTSNLVIAGDGGT